MQKVVKPLLQETQWVARAAEVRDPEDMAQVLAGAQWLAELGEPVLQRNVVAASIAAIPAIAEALRAQSFNALLSAVGQLPERLRFSAYAALGGQVRALPEPEWLAGYGGIEQALMAPAGPPGQNGPPGLEEMAVMAVMAGHLVENKKLPLHCRSMLLAVLVEQTERLNDDQRPAFFAAAGRSIERLPLELQAGPLLALAGQVGAMPEPGRRRAFDTVREAVGRVPAGQRSGVLAALATQLGRLDAEDMPSRFDDLVATYERPPVADKAALLEAIAGQIGALAPEQRGREMFDRLLVLVEALPDAWKARSLGALVDATKAWGGSSLRHAFSKLQGSWAQIPAGPVASMLARLGKVVHEVPGDALVQAFNVLLDAVRPLPAEHLAGPVAALARQFQAVDLPSQAWHGLEPLVAALPPQSRAESLEPLAGAIANLPASQQLEALCRALDMLDPIPAEKRGASFLAMADIAQHVDWLHGEPARIAKVFDAFVAVSPELPSEQRSLPLSVAAGLIPRLREEVRAGAFERLLHLTGRSPPGLPRARPARTLAEMIPALPQDAREAAFGGLMKLLGPDGCRGQPEIVKGLAHGAGTLPGYAPRAAVASLLRAWQTLPAGELADALTVLARAVMPQALGLGVPRRSFLGIGGGRLVSRERLIDGFIKALQRLPPETRRTVAAHIDRQLWGCTAGDPSAAGKDKMFLFLRRLRDVEERAC